MATLMEKDVLIEFVATASATMLSRLHRAELEESEDIKYLANLRMTIYRSKPEKLDFDDIVKNVRTIINRYKDLPKLKR